MTDQPEPVYVERGMPDTDMASTFARCYFCDFSTSNKVAVVWGKMGKMKIACERCYQQNVKTQRRIKDYEM